MRIFLVLIFLLPLMLADASGYGASINILYTGAMKGELEPCGCSPKNQSGGLTRLSAYVSSNKDALSPYIMIDAGNSLAEDTAQGRFKIEAMLDSFSIIGYDAVALLSRDIALPKSFLNPIIEKNKTPVLFADGGGRIVEAGALKINVSADEGARSSGMFNVLLTEKPLVDARLLEGWQVIITSSGETLDEPEKTASGVLVSGYQKGKRLGILGLEVDKKGLVTSVKHRWQTLNLDMSEDMLVREILKVYDAKVAGLLKDEEAKAVSDGPYLGIEACAQCHQPFAEHWRTTRHPGAFVDLEKAGKSKDPECVKCHTTGYAKEGGFYSMAATPGLAGVQCEACHGPGKWHLEDLSAPMRPVQESICLACHTNDNSPDFDFAKYLEKISHVERIIYK
ncbi:MAG: hypothetical protein A3J24_03885 [Deltaproteobacteria bacterium RIFCSPLOWO2_02_FULL_53_8]|nr:MAG: hypothetical protein A3J24_03885 [Deltaproteobacteria bacterium RIFCSPLOWO2_02_FULL_53_8]